jgi:DNA-directed RNA polymerase specialized sigma subunit
MNDLLFSVVHCISIPFLNVLFMHEAKPESVEAAYSGVDPRMNLVPDAATDNPLRETTEIATVPRKPSLKLCPSLSADGIIRVTDGELEVIDRRNQELARDNIDVIKTYVWAKAMSCHESKRGAVVANLPDSFSRQMVIEAFKQNPFAPMQSLSINVEGQKISISYWSFGAIGALEKFKQYYEEALDEYLSTFERVCEFVLHDKYFRKHGGWNRVKKWHRTFIERSFEENPFVPESQQTYTHNGQTFLLPYQSYRRDGNAAEYGEMYNEILRKYVNRSYANAEAFIFHEGFCRRGGWALVDESYQREFCKRAFEQHPFTGVNYLGLEKNGKTVRLPITGKSAPVYGWMREILVEYLEKSLDRVVTFVSGDNFNVLCGGGWGLVPKKWHKVLVVKAVLDLGPGEKLIRDSLVYEHGDGRAISLNGLYKHYLSRGIGAEFGEYVDYAYKAKETIEDRYHADPVKEASLKNEVYLVAMAVAGDKDSAEAVVQTMFPYCDILARKYSYGNYQLYLELKSYSVARLYCFLGKMRYDREDAASFFTVAHGVLSRDMKYHAMGYMRGINDRRAYRFAENHARMEEAVVSAGVERSASVDDISALTGFETRTIVRHQQLNRVSASMDAPLTDEGTFDLHSVVGGEDDQSAILEKDNLLESLETVTGRLPLRERIVVELYFGIGKSGNRGVDQLKRVIGGRKRNKSIDLDQLAETAIQNFVNALAADFCDTDSPIVDEKFKSSIRGVSRMGSYAAVLDGRNYLGKVLKGNGDEFGAVNEKLSPYLSQVVGKLSPLEIIILVEMFKISSPRTFTCEVIGDFLCVTRQRGQQILEKIKARLKRSLNITYKVDSVDDILPKESVSSWERIASM